VGSTSSPKAPSRALGCVFLPFFLLGSFFVVMVLRGAIASAATYTWQSVSCRIIESQVLESSENSPWFGYLRYQSPTGESVRSSRLFGTYREALLFTRRWPAGSSATCWLDPRDPAGALLDRGGSRLTLLLFLPIPLFFVFIGAVGFYSCVFRWRPKLRAARPANPVAIHRFGAASMIAIGLALFLAFLFGPVRHVIAARSWRAHECLILRSEVRRYAAAKGGNGYAPKIFYSYAVNDREHRSDVWSFFEYTANGWGAAQRLASGYRPRSTVTCYVNPADPDDATLNRNPSLGWLWGFLPLCLAVAGAALWPR
jgi:hypothetical protein